MSGPDKPKGKSGRGRAGVGLTDRVDTKRSPQEKSQPNAPRASQEPPNKKNPARRAHIEGQLEIVKALLSAPSDANIHRLFSLLTASALCGNEAVVDAIVSGAPEMAGMAEPETGLTALHYAAAGGDLSTVGILLGSEADPFAQDRWSREPVFIAIEAEQYVCAELLSDHMSWIVLSTIK